MYGSRLTGAWTAGRPLAFPGRPVTGTLLVRRAAVAGFCVGRMVALSTNPSPFHWKVHQTITVPRSQERQRRELGFCISWRKSAWRPMNVTERGLYQSFRYGAFGNHLLSVLLANKEYWDRWYEICLCKLLQSYKCQGSAAKFAKFWRERNIIKFSEASNMKSGLLLTFGALLPCLPGSLFKMTAGPICAQCSTHALSPFFRNSHICAQRSHKKNLNGSH